MHEINNQPTVAVVILNWNGRKYLEQFLPSVLASTYKNVVIYVADNGSTDDSVSYLTRQYPEIKILSYSTNEGFAGGYNRALKEVDEELLVLLNSDIEVTPGWLEPAIDLFSRHADLAAIQPKILDYNNKANFEYAGAGGGWIDRFGYPFSKGRIFDILEKDERQYDTPTEIFWASGASMIIKKSVFNEVGGFDPFFFAHQEEIDICWRIHLAGYKIMSCPSSVVYHIGGGTLAKDNPDKIFLNFRNNLIMLWKNLSGLEAIYVLLVRFLLDATSAWKNLIVGKTPYFIAVARAHMGFMGWLISGRSQSVYPVKRSGQVKGIYKGSVVWQHFVLGKNKFSEIITEST
jgi:GT2 family glycosyltransferase